MTEKELIIDYKQRKSVVQTLQDELFIAKKRRDETEAQLLELLDREDKTRSASYEGIGYVTAVKPRLFASCKEENVDNLFTFLKGLGREDLIKEKVHPGSLSTLIGERVEQGLDVPEFINYYLKQSIRVNDK